MTEFIQIIPIIMNPLLLGILFVETFRRFTALNRGKDYEYKIMVNYLIGYVLSMGFSYLNIKFIEQIIITIFLGVVAGKLYQSNFWVDICDKLHIQLTLEECFWDTVLDIQTGHRIRAWLEDEDFVIEGTIQTIESESDNPKLALHDYKIFNKNLEVQYEYDLEETQMMIIIDLAKCEFIEIQYENESKMLKLMK